jgi:hypothetical protein
MGPFFFGGTHSFAAEAVFAAATAQVFGGTNGGPLLPYGRVPTQIENAPTNQDELVRRGRPIVQWLAGATTPTPPLRPKMDVRGEDPQRTCCAHRQSARP